MQNALKDFSYHGVVFKSNIKHLCAGGDVKVLAIDNSKVPDFFRTEFSLFHYLKRNVPNSVVILKGITYGGGFGLA